MIQRIALLVTTLAILLGLMIHRYDVLRVEFDNTRFFNNAVTALSFTVRGEMDSQIPPIPQEIKTSEGNLMPRLYDLYRQNPPIPIKAVLDPFLPPLLSNRFLSLHFGYVEHQDWTPTPERALDRPTWFVYSVGPSRSAPNLIESTTKENQRVYRFQSSPYQVSNGLHSQGYLYVDSRGNRIGKIR